MGGRGSSSASLKKASVPVSEMSRSQVLQELEALAPKIQAQSDIMFKYANESTGYRQGAPWGTKSGHEKYTKALAEYQSLRGRERELNDRRWAIQREKVLTEAKPANRTNHTFVNGFGEATTRYVTSDGYERATRRNEREIQSRMKGFR